MIKQRYPQDCGVACLAMFLGVTYEEAQNYCYIEFKTFFMNNGMNIEQIAKIIKYRYEPVIIRSLIPDAKAILCVPSLGIPKSFHYIYFDGKNIFDPSNFSCYSNDDFSKDLPMSEAIILKKDSDKYTIPSHLINYFDWDYINATYS